MCQRVIHPQLQSHLRSRGVRFIQRLSSDATIPICRISGAKLFSSINVTGDISALRERIGALSRIDKVRLPDGKDYLHIMGSNSNSYPDVQTLILCSPTEEHFLETKSLVRASLATLKTAVVDSPMFVDGGGCFLACLRAHLSLNEAIIAGQIQSKLHLEPLKLLPRLSVRLVAEVFERVITSMSATEKGLKSIFGDEGHHWVVDPITLAEGETVACECRRRTGVWSNEEENLVGCADRVVEEKSIDGRVVDSFHAVMDAVRNAFQLAAILIHTNKVIAAT